MFFHSFKHATPLGWDDGSSRETSHVTTRWTMATTQTTRREVLTRQRSSAMVTNVLRVALYTVTYCRGTRTRISRMERGGDAAK